MTRLGNELRLRREQAGLSQTELAKATGVSQNYLSSLERGQIDSPAMELLCKIGLKFGLTPNDLASLAEWWSPTEVSSMPPDLTRAIDQLLKLPYGEQHMAITVLRRIVNAASMDSRGLVNSSSGGA